MRRCKNCGRSLEDGEGRFLGEKYNQVSYVCSDRCYDEWKEREKKKEERVKMEDEKWVKDHPTLANIRRKFRIACFIAFILFIIYCFVSGQSEEEPASSKVPHEETIENITPEKATSNGAEMPKP